MILTKKVGHASLLLANIIFGLNTVISRSLIPDVINPYLLNLFRMAGAAALFWTLSIFLKKEHVQSKDILLFFFASIFGIVLNQIPYILGLSMTSPIDASLIITLLPVITMLLAAIIIKEPITWLKVVGVIVGAFGALLLILSSSHIPGQSNLTGNMILFISITSFSLYLTLFKKLISRYSAVTSMKWMFMFATIIMLPFTYKLAIKTHYEELDSGVYLRIGYVVALATFFTYLLLPLGQKTLRPTTMSLYNYVQPISATFMAVVIGMDKFSPDKIISTVLVFAGVYIVTQSKSRAQVEEESQMSNKAQQSDIIQQEKLD